MISKERQSRILAYLQTANFASVKELTEMLHASRSSIVRDLITLEEQGLLVRQRGGAALKTVDMTMTSFQEVATEKKEKVNPQAKQIICKEAAKSIQDGQCIYVDSGSTTAYLLPYLSSKDIILVTSSTYLIRKMPLTFQGNVFLLGGNYSRSLDMSLGALTLEMISHFHFDQAFMSANGLDLDTGDVFSTDFELGAVKKAIMQRSTTCDLLVDASKFHIKAIATWANIQDFNKIYVDSYPSDHEIYDMFEICQGGKEDENK